MESYNGWVGETFRIMELWDPTVIGLEGIIEPQNPITVGLEGITEPRNPIMVGLERPLGSWNCEIL